MKRIAVIDKERCNPIGCGGYLCIKRCPVNRMGKEAIVIGPDKKAFINEEVATDACQVCVNICPYNAIHMVKLPDELTTRPIHRYGKDQFMLYSLPTPLTGKVVGILGVNGIGKSTAIKVLAGVLHPNLGNPDAPQAEITQLIRLFKGTEAQAFFEKLRDREIKVSYKPQDIEKIPKAAKGKVRDLLKKVDQKKKLEQVAAQLEITPILDNDISEISGGELQRVAIAATVLKDANLFIFDEPSSYLDIKQRLRIAQFIKSLANESTS
ncbi:ATP-binding cassette domain-containing protein, partial [Candidatus Woesearchaeota archaeon]|nr:ATP-binding cassette domain-containing protein [Candidatus Woesearchaeota archaeon]